MKKIMILIGLLSIIFTNIAIAEDYYIIGQVASLTGSTAYHGELSRQGAQLAIDEINKNGGINGKKLKLEVYDSASDPTKTIIAFKKLYLNDEIKIVILTASTPENLAVRSIIDKHQIPVIGLSSSYVTYDPVNPWVFSMVPSDFVVMRLIFEDMKQKHIKKIAMLNINTSLGQSGTDIIYRYAKEYGMKIVIEEKYAPTDLDMRAQLTKIKFSKAQALISWGLVPGTAVVARQMKQLSINLPMYTSNATSTKKLYQVAGESTNGVYAVVPKIMLFDDLIPKKHKNYTEMKKFLDVYNKSTDKPLDSLILGGYNSVHIIAKAIKNDKQYTRDSLRNHLEKTQIYNSTGLSKFTPENHKGSESKDNFMICQWKDGKFINCK